MSDESPNPPPDHYVYGDPQLEPRIEAAAALRRLGHALVRHRTDDASLSLLARTADEATDQLNRTAEVPRPDDYMARRYIDDRPLDGARVTAFSDRPFSGPSNPMGFEVDLRRHGEACRARIVFGAAFESAPGRAHGGAISAAVDDVMGYLMVILGVAAYTARLEVDYLAGVPVDQPVWFAAAESARDGRKLHVDLTARTGSWIEPDLDSPALVAAHGLFVVVPPENFASS